MTSTNTGFTCVACGVVNGRAANGKAFNSCQTCGASVHIMFGTTDYPPCGGIMTVVKQGTATVKGVSVRVQALVCECGWRPVFPAEESCAQIEVNIVGRIGIALNPGIQMFEGAQ
jgi:hypothetical protein